jgi:guanyl-specific ribonuclease Sa
MAKPRSVADFKAAHDPNVIVPAKIRKGLELIAKDGPENWVYEVDFLKLSGVSTTQLATFRDQFAEYIVETPAQHGKNVKRVYFGNAKVAAKLRG